MSFQGTYIGWGIEISIEELGNILKLQEDDVHECDDYEIDTIVELLNYVENNEIFGLNLTVLDKHYVQDDKNVYFGEFIHITDNDFGSMIINNEQSEKIKNILTDSAFKAISLEHFKEEPKLMTISIGCYCCS